MKALILAAGYATRMYPLNKMIHKALLPLGKETILGHITGLVNELPACDEIIVVSNHRFIEDFRKWKQHYHGSIPLDLLDDGTADVTESLGAIGDICYTIKEKQLDDDLLIIAGDTYFDFPLEGFVTTCSSHERDGVCVKKVEDENLLRQMGVVLLGPDKTIINIEEKPDKPKSNLAMYAIYYYSKDTVRLFSQYCEEGNPMDAPGNYIVWLYSRKPIITYPISGHCHDIGTVEAYSSLCKLLGIAYSLSGMLATQGYLEEEPSRPNYVMD